LESAPISSSTDRPAEWRGPDAGTACQAVAMLVASITVPPKPDDEGFRFNRGADCLEVRADLVGDLPANWIRQRFNGLLIYARRPTDKEPRPTQGNGHLSAAADGFDLIELDAERDLLPEVLAKIPPEQRIIAWRGPLSDVKTLGDHLRRISMVPARFYLLSGQAVRLQDALTSLKLLSATGRRDVISYAEGERGLWGRILSVHLGAPAIYSGFGPGGFEPDLAALVDDFGLQRLSPIKCLYGISGRHVIRSLSPRLHNAAYRALGIPAVMLPLPAESLCEMWQDLIEDNVLENLGLPLHGLIAASPLKEGLLTKAEVVSSESRCAVSANLAYRRGQRWVARTTDPAGVLTTLRRRGVSVAGMRAVVVGCGGAGRAIAAALKRAGTHVILSNRGRLRGEMASSRLGIPLASLTSLDPARFDLIVNATSVGRDEEMAPINFRRIDPTAILVDLVYDRFGTPLTREALARGVLVVEGREVLLTQAVRQFACMTGRSMPETLAVSVLGLDKSPVANLAPRRSRFHCEF
jgi:3-dehydroquinate dehydratase / shikimate dehydrogenase